MGGVTAGHRLSVQGMMSYLRASLIHTLTDLNQGQASYYHVLLSSGDRFENIVWWYPNTTVECTPIRGFVAFFDEKVDVWVDGEKQERPISRYSAPQSQPQSPTERMEDSA